MQLEYKYFYLIEEFWYVWRINITGGGNLVVLDTNLTFAVRCNNCGKIGFHSISAFELPLNTNMDFYCECGSVEMTVTLSGNRGIAVKIPCLACDINHTYKYSFKNILGKRLTVVCCTETGLELCFLGNQKDVKDIVSKYQEDLHQLLGELGLFEGLDIDNKNWNKHV